MPAKRKNTGKQASNGNAKQSKQDGQKAVSHEIEVPIDEGFKEGCAVKVWIEDDGTIMDASLNQTNIGGNNNKVCSTCPVVWRVSFEGCCSSTDYSFSTMRNPRMRTSITLIHDGAALESLGK